MLLFVLFVTLFVCVVYPIVVSIRKNGSKKGQIMEIMQQKQSMRACSRKTCSICFLLACILDVDNVIT